MQPSLSARPNQQSAVLSPHQSVSYLHLTSDRRKCRVSRTSGERIQCNEFDHTRGMFSSCAAPAEVMLHQIRRVQYDLNLL